MKIPMSGGELYTQSRARRLSLLAVITMRRLKQACTVYAQNRLAVFGALLILLFAMMAVAHPVLINTVWPKVVYDPQVGFDLAIYPHPSPPSQAHLLGTDTLGRDVLSRLLAATTPTFVMALVAALTTAIVGTLVGAFSAYFRGAVDSFFSHLADVALLAPAPLVMVVIGFMLDISPFQFGAIFGLLTGIGGVAIVMRSYALTVVTKPFIDAARVAGGGSLHIIFRHLVPHMLPLAAVNMMLAVTGAIFADGFVAFLGLSRARLNWGTMIYDSFTYQALSSTITWNVLVPSALAISLFAGAFYFIASGLHQVAEPRLREE
jgi:peptide/nickel transport system permease protein